ncbi:Ribosomal protein L18ae family [Euphorbia peplus]|nr:Ribosomal protein L18ae family [Euphorbia peplus]
MEKTDQGDGADAEGEYIQIRDEEEPKLGMFDKPLPCCGCGFGWFCFLLGFVFPLLWYLATIFYFGKYYDKDPRERSGLAACAIAATFCTVAAVILVLVFML